MKKSILTKLGIGVVGLVVLTGCGNSGSTSTTSEGEAQTESVTLKLGHHLAADHIVGQRVQELADTVEEKSNGQLQIEIIPGGQLGGQSDLIDGTEMGTVDMTIVDTGVMANFYQPLGLLDTPYIFDSIDHAYNALNGDLGEQYKQEVLENNNVKLLALEPTSFRSLAMSKSAGDFSGEVSISDLASQTIRVLDSPLMVSTFQAMQTNPVSIPSGEVYSALETNVVKGMESNAEFMASISIPEVANSFIETQHVLVNQALLINTGTFDDLSDEMKTLLEESVAETSEWYNQEVKAADEEAKKSLEESGMEMLKVNTQEFRDATQKVTENFIKENEVEDKYELIQQAREE